MRIGWVNDWGSKATVRYSYEHYSRYLRDKGDESEVYDPGRRYDFVFFVKSFYPEHQKIAREAARKGARTVLFNSVNYYDTWGEYPEASVLPAQVEEIHRMTEIVDATVGVSPFLKETADKYFPGKNHFIHEPVDGEIFNLVKQHENGHVDFIFCSTSGKCAALELIANVIDDWRRALGNSLYVISDGEPDLSLDYRFVDWGSDADCARNLLLGDVYLAPRSINSYDYGHSISKISHAMAQGIPVIASPLSSYETSPATLCVEQQEWNEAIKAHADPAVRREKGRQQSQWVADNCTIAKCGDRLVAVLEALD